MMGRSGVAAILVATALMARACTVVWSGGEQTGPTARTDCAGATAYRRPGSSLYEGMPAPPTDPDHSLFSVYCSEAP